MNGLWEEFVFPGGPPSDGRYDLDEVFLSPECCLAAYRAADPD
jgi:hypothetical protein